MPTGNLPEKPRALWEQVYNENRKKGLSESESAKRAWGAISQAGWSKDKDGNWHKKAELTEFSLAIKRASFDPKTGERRWKADTSDIDDDSYDDCMSMDLFKSFIERIENKERPPEEFCSEFWSGGMPYVSVSHYPDLNGEAVPGMPEAVYIDGKFFKAKGKMFDNPVGRAAWDALKKDQEEKSENPVRVSIAFLDYKHQHKSNGYVFERKGLDDFCPECFKELLKGEYAGRKFLDGHLIHLALTRVPVNKRTLMEVDRSMTTRKEDAESIVGEELADEMEKQASLVGKSEALIIKADEEVSTEEVVSPNVETEPDNATVALAMTISDIAKSLVELRDAMTELRASMKKDEKEDEDDDEEDDEEKKKMKEEEKAELEPTINPSLDLVQAFSEAVAPITQRLDILIAAQSKAMVNVPQQIVPERRSIAPSSVPQGIQPQQTGPMKISDFVRKSVGLNG